MPRVKRLRQSASHCHICGLIIPVEIVSSKHPLYGTIDHVIPLSKGGKDKASNRAPAHNLCNRHKADKPELSPKEKLKAFKCALACLNEYNATAKLTLTKRQKIAAKRRAGILDRHGNEILEKAKRTGIGYESNGYNYLLSIWDNEGGASYNPQ